MQRPTHKMPYPQLFLATFLHLNHLIVVGGNYTLNITLVSYTNQDNWCSVCSDDEFGCCDDYDVRICTGSNRCDTYFEYCLLPLETAISRDHLQCNPVATSTILMDDGPIDFTQSVVLGLSNPLLLSGTSTNWAGILLQISTLDSDGSNSYDLIDVFHLRINNRFGSVMLTGYHGLTQMELAYQVMCNEGFYGDACQFFNDCPGLEVCGENGVCIDGDNSYSCRCDLGYKGDHCEFMDDCVGVDCNYQGECMDGENLYTCHCYAGFTGMNCEINIDDCVLVNCNERGHCMDGNNSYICLCDAGFTGEDCGVNIDDCVNNSCSGNGVCVDGVNTFSCECDPGYAGELCGLVVSCSSIGCVNGYCNPNESTPACVCNPGYTGNRCQVCSGGGCSDIDFTERNGEAGMVQSRLVFIIGVTLGGFSFLLLLLIVILTIVVLASCRDARRAPSTRQVTESALKRPESFNLTGNIAYGVFAEAEQQSQN